MIYFVFRDFGANSKIYEKIRSRWNKCNSLNDYINFKPFHILKGESKDTDILVMIF